MKKFLLATMLAILFVPNLWAQEIYRFDRAPLVILDRTSQPDSSLKKDWVVLRRNKENFGLNVWLRTVGATCTMKVLVQSANENLTKTTADSLGWQNLTIFGAAVTGLTAGHAARTFYGASAVSAGDTTRFIGRYLRVRVNLGDVGFHATDTARYKIYFLEWGNDISTSD